MSTAHCIYKSGRVLMGSLPRPFPLNVLRRFSSGNSVGPYPTVEPNLPPWIKIPIGMPSNNPDLMKMLEDESSKFIADHDEASMKVFFESKVEDFLTSNCLLVDEEFDKPSVKRIHLMNRKLIGHCPLYTNARRLVWTLLKLNENHRDHLLKTLAYRRVLVFKEWGHHMPPIETQHYDHGLQLAPHTGADDSFTYKIESDASFSEKSKTASAAFLIWKVQRLLECQLNSGLSCNSSGEAEMLGILAALIRGKELMIEKVDIVTDCKVNSEVLSGSLDPQSTPYPKLCMAVLEVAKEFKAIRCRWEPREVLRTVDEIAKSRYPLKMVEVLETRTFHFWGLPVFRINEEKNRAFIDKKFAKNVRDKTIIYPNDVFLRAEDIDARIEGLSGLVLALRPPFIIVVVGSKDEASRVEAALKGYKGSVVDASNSICEVGTHELSLTKFSAVFLVNPSSLPQFPEEKCLFVLFDNPRRSIPTLPANVITLRFLSRHEDALGSVKVDPTLYGFFRSYDPYASQDLYTIMTINVRGSNGEFNELLLALGNLVEVNKPDIICLNCLCPGAHLELLKHSWFKEFYPSIYYPDATMKSEYTLLLSKLKVSFDQKKICESDLSIAHVAFTTKNTISVASFEDGGSITIHEAMETIRELGGRDNAVFCGGGLRDLALPAGWVDVSQNAGECGVLASSMVCKLTELNVESATLVGENLGVVITVSLPKK